MDYSPYYFRREPRKRESGEPRGGYEPKRTGRRRRGLRIEAVMIVVIFLCLVTALILANVWSGEKIIAAITAAFRDENVFNYYAVTVGEFADEREAVVQATVIRAGGGAGYIFAENGKYSVALATYMTQDEAKAVSEKNEGSSVYEITADVGTLYDTSSDDAAIHRTVEDLTRALATLEARCAEYAANEASAADTLTAVGDVRNSLYATKEYLYSVKADPATVGALLNAVEPVFAGTEALVMDNHSDELNAAMRYIVTSGAFALRALCAAR